jgi:putative NADH-flavin reductase
LTQSTGTGLRIVIFGAAGRAGSAAVAEARRRGHRVTAVARDRSRYHGEADEGVHLVEGDVTDSDTVAAFATGHDAAINTTAVYGEGTDPDAFFPAASRALIKGLTQAGVPRLVTVGLSVLLPGIDGTLGIDAPDFPAAFRPFCLAHGAGLEVLRTEGGSLDWIWISPAGDFDHDGPRTGRYEVREHQAAQARISYADFAIALVDEAQESGHSRTQLIVS